jgi:coiled-coil domain-containing protein 130
LHLAPWSSSNNSLSFHAMSSLAATQADGYYLPPECYESGAYRNKSKNQWHQQQQQSTTRKGTVRFELPYRGICQTCHVTIARGTRYNATKHTTDQSYFTTPILEFHMQCRACTKQLFVIATDPAARGFRYVSGIQRRAGDDDDEEEKNNKPKYEKVETTTAIQTNLDRLEVMQLGKTKALSEYDALRSLQTVGHNRYADDADRNAQLRSHFRGDRKSRKQRLREGEKRGWKEGMALLDATHVDECVAQSQVYGNSKLDQERRWKQMRKSSIFNSCSQSTSKRKRPRRIKKEDAPSSPVDNSLKSVPSRNSYAQVKEEPQDLPDATVTSSTLPLAKRVRQFVPPTLSGLPAPSSEKPSALHLLAGYESFDDDDK